MPRSGWRSLVRTNDGGSSKGVGILEFLGSFACMLPVRYIHDLQTIARSGAFFFAELIVATIWAIPMGIAPDY